MEFIQVDKAVWAAVNTKCHDFEIRVYGQQVQLIRYPFGGRKATARQTFYGGIDSNDLAFRSAKDLAERWDR